MEENWCGETKANPHGPKNTMATDHIPPVFHAHTAFIADITSPLRIPLSKLTDSLKRLAMH